VGFGGEAVLIVVEDDAADESPWDGGVGDDAVAGPGEGGDNGIAFYGAGEASLFVVGEFGGAYADGGAGIGDLANEAGGGCRGRGIVFFAGGEDKEGGKEKEVFHEFGEI